MTEMMRLSKISTRSDTIRSRALAVWNLQRNFYQRKGKLHINHPYIIMQKISTKTTSYLSDNLMQNKRANISLTKRQC